MRNGTARARFLTLASGSIFVLAAALYVAGALRASPGLDLAASDLDLIARWKATGRLQSLPQPTHLTKPGYVTFLRAALPSEGAAESENRRFLLLNALWVLAGVGVLAYALQRTCGRLSAALFLLFVLILLPLRDAADYILTEPLAACLSMLSMGALILGWRSSRSWMVVAGAVAGLLALIRANEGIVLVCLAAVMLLSRPRPARAVMRDGLISLGVVLLLGVGFLRLIGYRSESVGGDVAKTLMWGTSDYYWLQDIGEWPMGSTAHETRVLQLRRVEKRWADFFGSWSENRERSLVWRTLHGLLAADELPPRVQNPRYRTVDRFFRSWWWLVGAGLISLAVAVAVGGSGPLRFLGMALIALCIAQSLTCGADPRLILPYLPVLAALVLGGLASTRWGMLTWAAFGASAAVLLWQSHRIPDVADFDFALLRGEGRRIEQVLPASSVAPAGRQSIHFRLLQEAPSVLGFRARLNGRTIVERRPGDATPYPAYFSAILLPEDAAMARREGLRLSVETLGPPGSQAVHYFPITPGVLGGRCAIDGMSRFPSGFGGNTSGGWPIWLTAD